MGTINRNNKPNGSTNYVDGDTVGGVILNGDINPLYNEFNGNIENVNISPTAGIVGTKLEALTLTNAQMAAAANIAPSKVDDYSATNAQQNAQSNPGTSAANTLAVLLTKELEQLRFAIRRNALGANAKITNGTTSGLAADGNAAWFDSPVIGPSVIRNGAFLDASANGAANPPFGWTTVGSPSTLARVALDVSEGAGEAIHIVDDGVGIADGLSQTLTGLRASSLYLVVCRVKPITTTWKLKTTGATGTFGNLDLTSASGGSVWQTLSGVISTDATPTAIVVSLTAGANASACHVCLIDVFPIGADPVDRSRNFGRSAVSSVVGPSIATVEAETTVGVVVPGPGNEIHVHASAYVIPSAEGALRIQLSVNGGAFTTVAGSDGGGDAARQAQLTYSEPNPTPGSSYVFRISAVAGTNFQQTGGASPFRATRNLVRMMRN